MARKSQAVSELLENKKIWGLEEIKSLQKQVIEEFQFSEELSKDEQQIYSLQDSIYSLNETRNVRTLELSNLDRKINFVIQSQLLKSLKKSENDTFFFFDQSASQDNPLGDKKSYYSGFLYLLRVEPQYLAKAVMKIPFVEMDYMVQCLNFSLFPDLFQAREELYLLDLIKNIIINQVELALEPTDVLRQNSFVTKLLSGYTKRHFGQVHLTISLKAPVLEFLNLASESPIAMEMNPEMIYKHIAGKSYNNSISKEEIMKIPEVIQHIESSRKKLEEFSIKVLDAIVENLDSMPFGIRYLSKQMILLAQEKFELTEKQVFLMISSFIILRYFNPALLCPDVFGIIDRDLSPNVRRALVLLSKIIQNYANDTTFGGKELYMQPFNDTRYKGIDILKNYYKKVTEVPEPQEYYATVANLPTRKEDVHQAIFHNTCVTISPNQLFTIHRLFATHKEEILPKFHPLSFFLEKLGDPPANVERQDDKIFTMALSGGDDDEVDDTTKLELLMREVSETSAQAFANLPISDDTIIHSNPEFLTLLKASLEGVNPEAKGHIEKAIKALEGLKNPAYSFILVEIERYIVYRQGYRNSLRKEKEEMLKSLETLQHEAKESEFKEALYTNYLENIIKNAFITKLNSKKEYQDAIKIGPLDYSFSSLEKLGCFSSPKDIESSIRKSTTFFFSCSEPGRVEISLYNSSTKETKTIVVGISALLDLLTSQDTARIHGFVFDLRNFITFLNSEVCG